MKLPPDSDSKESLLPAPTTANATRSRSLRIRQGLITLAFITLSLYHLHGDSFLSRSPFHHGLELEHDSNSDRGYFDRFFASSCSCRHLETLASSNKWGKLDAGPSFSTFSRNPSKPYHHRHDRDRQPQDWSQEFLKVPTAESARKVSESFTRETHIAGTAGDRESAERVKNQWQDLLGLEQTEPGQDVFDAGTIQDRQNLMGRHERHHHRNHHHHEGCRVRRRGRWTMRTILRKVKQFFFRLSQDDNLDYRDSLVQVHRENKETRYREYRREVEKPRVWISTYYPYLNYPKHQSLTLYHSGNSTPSFVATLKEDVFGDDQDPTSSKGVPTFHGFSKNGSARGELVYASRGTEEDFERLRREGIDVKGKVVIVQYGGSFRGLKVKAAEEAGAVACIIYSDPAADGQITLENGYAPYPLGPARAPSSVQRGSVQYLSIRPGDPLTPAVPAYNPSSPTSPDRLPMNDTSLNIPKIPSLPISYEDAIPLLQSLNQKGIKFQGREGWKEGGLRYRGVDYWSGPAAQVVELVNEMEDKVTKIWNTMAIIPGVVADEIVVIGNHNDAWTFGAGDPNSGTASMHETIKGFSHLMKTKDWKPFRTILLCSWDAEEYGLIGSTEFGEDFTDWLRERVVAYLNLDVSVSGSSFELAASPSLADLLRGASEVVQDPTVVPSQHVEEEKGQDLGSTKVKTLGSGSDFSVFLQYIGVAAGNLGFSPALNDPVYHYHSNYDSFAWMSKFGDPTFERHIVVSKILGLTALRLIDDLVLPLNTTAYAVALEGYLTKVADLPSYPGREQLDLTKLGAQMVELLRRSRQLDERAEQLVSRLHRIRSESHRPPSDSGHERYKHHDEKKKKHQDKERRRKEVKAILKEIRTINRKKQSFESTLLVPRGQPGLVGREWYKSLVVAPGRWLGYGATTLPGLTEAIQLDRDVEQAHKEVERLEQAMDRAIKLLKT